MPKGSCLCGAVSFEVTGSLPPPDACHCTQCRKQSGHFFVSTDVPRSAVTIHGEDKLTWYRSSEKVRRGFCSTCGSSLFWDPIYRDWIGIAMGAFEQPTGTKLRIPVLSANYILASLKDVMTAPFGDGPCMHEALFDDSFLNGTGITTLDFAKAMIDEGYHPMTMYFPLVVHGAMLIEPTESESKESLDRFIHVLRQLALEARAGKTERFLGAPRYAPRRRMDETLAARRPMLRWKPAPVQEAAE